MTVLFMETTRIAPDRTIVEIEKILCKSIWSPSSPTPRNPFEIYRTPFFAFHRLDAFFQECLPCLRTRPHTFHKLISLAISFIRFHVPQTSNAGISHSPNNNSRNELHTVSR